MKNIKILLPVLIVVLVIAFIFFKKNAGEDSVSVNADNTSGSVSGSINPTAESPSYADPTAEVSAKPTAPNVDNTVIPKPSVDTILTPKPSAEPAVTPAEVKEVGLEEIFGDYSGFYRVLTSIQEAGKDKFEPNELLDTEFDINISKGSDGQTVITFYPTRTSLNGVIYPEESYEDLVVSYNAGFENGSLLFRLDTEAFFLYSETPLDISMPFTRNEGIIKGDYESTFQKDFGTYETKTEIVFSLQKK